MFLQIDLEATLDEQYLTAMGVGAINWYWSYSFNFLLKFYFLHFLPFKKSFTFFLYLSRFLSTFNKTFLIV